MLIKIDQGDLEGCVNTTENGFNYKSFYGIPYAKPPIGNLRFKDPVPADGWTGIRDATQEGSIHCQLDKLFAETMIGSEDSLFINVHVPADVPPDTKLPVMVWIHGGAFQTGSGSKLIYGPDYLIQKNIIFVSLNYRLGVLGFLCLHTEEAPGNMGLKDQVLALKWVKKNIGKFGGDENNITIFGESAGGASVNLLMMSPFGEGLFNKAIMQSGVGLNSWSIQNNPEETAKALIEKLGMTANSKEDMLKIFQSTPPKKLYEIEGFTLADRYNFCPVVEKSYPNVTSFITKNPIEIMMSGNFNKVPVLCGHNSMEGILFASKEIQKNPTILKCTKLEESGLNIDFFMPRALLALDDEKKNAVKKLIIDRYFSGKTFLEAYVDFMTDVTFSLQIERTVLMLSHIMPHPVYYYLFDYNGSFNLYNHICKFKYTGAAHTDDLGYLFKPDIKKIIQTVYREHADKVTVQPSQSDIIQVQRMVEMWTNFAKFGNPSPEINQLVTTTWKPVAQNELNCLKIAAGLEMIVNPLGDRMKFWEQLMK